MLAAEWIDRVKSERGIESDYAVAKFLGVTRSTVSNYRIRPGATLDEDVSIKVAEALDLRPAVVMFDQIKERSKSPRVSEVLDEVIKAAGGKAASILLAAAVGVGAVGSPASARAGAMNSAASPAFTGYTSYEV